MDKVKVKEGRLTQVRHTRYGTNPRFLQVDWVLGLDPLGEEQGVYQRDSDARLRHLSRLRDYVPVHRFLHLLGIENVTGIEERGVV